MQFGHFIVHKYAVNRSVEITIMWNIDRYIVNKMSFIGDGST